MRSAPSPAEGRRPPREPCSPRPPRSPQPLAPKPGAAAPPPARPREGRAPRVLPPLGRDPRGGPAGRRGPHLLTYARLRRAPRERPGAQTRRGTAPWGPWHSARAPAARSEPRRTWGRPARPHPNPHARAPAAARRESRVRGAPAPASRLGRSRGGELGKLVNRNARPPLPPHPLPPLPGSLTCASPLETKAERRPGGLRPGKLGRCAGRASGRRLRSARPHWRARVRLPGPRALPLNAAAPHARGSARDRAAPAATCDAAPGAAHLAGPRLQTTQVLADHRGLPCRQGC